MDLDSLRAKLQALSRDELLAKARALASEERRIQAEFLVCLGEIERQGLHLALAYPSLHEFLVSELHYSDGAAYRRIQSLRLMNQIPEAKQAIEQGTLSLSTASTLQGFFQAEARLKAQALPPEQKRQLFEAIQGQSKRQVERLLAEVSPAARIPQERERPLNSTHSQLTVNLSQEVIEGLVKLPRFDGHGRNE